LVSLAAGACVYAVVEPVPATGRWRFMLFDHDNETEIFKPAAAQQFQAHWE
jgi:hypothetical protein